MIKIEHPYKGKFKGDMEERRLKDELKRYARERQPIMVEWTCKRIAEHIQEKEDVRTAKEKEAAVENEVASEIKARQAKVPVKKKP
jgi:hypothetical protein